VGNLKKRERLEDFCVGGRVTIINLREIVWDGFDWVHLTEASGKWRAVLNMVLSLRIPKISGGLNWLRTY
jgi:hypothetical protein